MINVEYVKPESINGLLIGQVVKIQTWSRRQGDPDTLVEGSMVIHEGKLIGISKGVGSWEFYLEGMPHLYVGEHRQSFELYQYVYVESEETFLARANS